MNPEVAAQLVRNMHQLNANPRYVGTDCLTESSNDQPVRIFDMQAGYGLLHYNLDGQRG